MNSPKIVFILSDNQDFIESLSSLVTRELQVECKKITTKSEIPAGNNYILITSNPITYDYQPPVITVILPVRAKALLTDIQATFANIANIDLLEITEEFQLSLKHKTITHLPTGATTALTDKETQLLQIITGAGTEVISREVLLKEIWKMDSDLDTHTLETHIYRLRKKIKDAFGIEMIKASDGGYKL